MTTEPFTTDGTGDYIDPFSVTEHDCNVSAVDRPPPENANGPTGLETINLVPCEWHGTCCATWELTAYCKSQLGKSPDFECANATQCHEYHPITDVMEAFRDGRKPTSWTYPQPPFPMELLYTRERQSDRDYTHITGFRERFCVKASRLYYDKKRLADIMNDAWDKLCEVQKALDTGAACVPDLVLPEIIFAIELVDMSRRQMNKVLNCARDAVKLYQALEYFLRNPMQPTSDGDDGHSLSMSRLNVDNLVEGPEGLNVVFEGFEGPMKGIPELFEWCKRMKLAQHELQATPSS